MKSNISLTPKDCLYIDDSLNQLCAVHAMLKQHKTLAEKKEVKDLISDVEKGLCNNYNAIKELLERAISE